MAAARRLSELLQEQQEPFLVEAARARRPRRGRGASGAAAAGGGLAGCYPAAACRRLLRQPLLRIVAVGSTVMSIVAGNLCCARSPVPSVALPALYPRAADVCGSSWTH